MSEQDQAEIQGKSDREITEALVERFRARREEGARPRLVEQPTEGDVAAEDAELEVEAEAEGDGEGEEGEEAQQPGAADEGQPLTIARLAEHWEMKPEEVLSSIMIDGADGQSVPLAQVVSAYRQPAPDRAEFARARERVAELERTEAQRTEIFDMRMGQLQDLTQLLLEDLQPLKPPDQRLLESNPTEYSVQHIRWTQKQDMLRSALGALKRHRDQQAEAKATADAEARAAQGRLLRAAMPEWQQDDTFRRDFESIVDYLRKQGFNDEQLMAASDHRQWLVARKAMLYDARPSKEDVLRKEKLARIPRTLRPGAQTTVQGSPRKQQKAIEATTATLQKTGRTKDAEAAVLARLRARGAPGAAGGRP